MGYLYYAPQQVFRFDDDLLSHLRAFIVTKLLQQESFIFTWSDEGLQRSIWLHPTLPLSFEFETIDVPPIDHEWVNALLALANGPGGLRLVPDPRTASPR